MDRRVIEGIEACRPASDDLRQADLADVARAVHDDGEARAHYEQVQAWDAAITGAMDQAEVPKGLAERILSRLPSTESVSAPPVPHVVTIDQPVDMTGSRAASRSRIARWRRREWLGAAATAAAVLLVSLLVYDRWSPGSGETSLDEQADGWLADLARDTTSWQAMSSAQRDFPVPDAVTASPTGWRPVKTARGVAYQLRNGVGKATLFVMKMATTGLPAAPPVNPQSTTGGRAIGYWQSGRLMYVLVVEGDQRSYRRFVSTSGAPFA
jgi:hypothetical protein